MTIHAHVSWCTHAKIFWSIFWGRKRECQIFNFIGKWQTLPESLCQHIFTNCVCYRNLLFQLITSLQKFTVTMEILLQGLWHIKLDVLLTKGLSSEWHMQIGPKLYAYHSWLWNLKITYKEQSKAWSPCLKTRWVIHCGDNTSHASGYMTDTERGEKNKWTATGGWVGKRGKSFILWFNLRPPTFKCSKTQTHTTGYLIKTLKISYIIPKKNF